MSKSHYDALNNFLHNSPFLISDVMICWIKIVIKYTNPTKINNRYILLGDATKSNCEGSKIPAANYIHNSSQNSGVGGYIWGHYFGCICMVIGVASKIFAIPLGIELQQGVNEEVRKLQNKTVPKVDKKEDMTSITLMISMALNIAGKIGPSILVLDAFYWSTKIFMMAAEYLDEYNRQLLNIIVRVKDFTTVYFDHPEVKKRKKYKLWSFFHTRRNEFETITVNVYGKSKKIQCLVTDLYWNKLTTKLRFVLCIDGENTFVLACNDLTWTATEILSAAQIVELYGLRFKIEVTFKYLKHLIGAFRYHFWSKVMPKLDRKKGSNTNNKKILEESMKDKSLKMKILATINATERFVFFGCIALGLLQIISILFHKDMGKGKFGYKRTYSSTIPSEKDVKNYVKYEYYNNSTKYGELELLKIINEVQGYYTN